MKSKIIPTIFAHNKKEFLEKFRKVVPISDSIQIDFMDGKFVKSKSVSLSNIPKLNQKKTFEAHLMVEKPEKYLAQLKRKGFKKIIFHLESIQSKEKVFLLTEKISSLKLSPFLALNPETPVKSALPFIPQIGGILLMGVHPGKENQKLIPSTLKKIRELRKLNNQAVIQIDGGVNEKTALKLFKAGANILNSGSFISKAENPKDALNKLKQI